MSVKEKETPVPVVYAEYAYNNGVRQGKQELSNEIKNIISQMSKDNFSSEEILTAIVNKLSEIKD